MIQVRIPKQQRFILDGVSWERYTRLLHMFSDRHLRMTYDRGILEIMTLSHKHEGLAEFLNWLVLTLAQELKLKSYAAQDCVRPGSYVPVGGLVR